MNTGYVAAARGFVILMRVVFVIIAARMLGPELYGTYAYIGAWYTAFLPIAMLGIGVILGRSLANDRGRATHLARQTFALRVIGAGVASTLAVAAWIIFEPQANQLFFVSVIACALIGRAVSNWSDSLLSALEEGRTRAGLEVLFRLGELLASIGALLLGGGLYAVLAVHALSWAIQASCSVLVAKRRVGGFSSGPGKDSFAVLLRAGSVLGTGGLLSVLMTTGGLILYRHFGASLSGIGQLAIAMQVLIFANVIPFALGAAALPVLARSVARGDQKDFHYLRVVISVAALGGAALFIILSEVGAWLATELLGERYREAAGLLGPVAVLTIPLICASSTSQLLTARRMDWSILVCAAFGAATLFGVFFLLEPVLGALRPIIATGAAFTVWMTALLLTYTVRVTRSFVQLQQLVGPILGAAVIVVSLVVLGDQVAPVRLGVSMVIFVGVFTVLLRGILPRAGTA